MNTQLNNYTFEYYGWIPGYNDFDQEWITISAASKEEAWAQVNKMKLYAKYGPGLTEINGQRIETELFEEIAQ